jgi:hypothetical protein
MTLELPAGSVVPGASDAQGGIVAWLTTHIKAGVRNITRQSGCIAVASYSFVTVLPFLAWSAASPCWLACIRDVSRDYAVLRIQCALLAFKCAYTKG